MPAAPPKAMEVAVGLLIPPASREHVLGDLHERFTSTQRYALEAARTVPLVILSRIRRTSDPVVLLMEAGVLYSAFLVAAWFAEPAFLSDESGLTRLAIPPAITLLIVMLADAYANPRKISPLKPILGAALAVGFAGLSQTLPRGIMIAGSSVSLLLLCTLRLLFPPPGTRPQSVNVPAHWQKQAVDPIGMRAIVVVAIAMVLLFALQLLTRGLR